MKRSLFVFVPVVAILVMGFKWVKLSPEGEKVRVLQASEVASCKKLGKTTVSVRAKLVGIKRKEKKVKTELEYQARNSAAADFEGGDTIVAISAVTEGKQKFDVYKCVNP
ncbi:MAG: DUF4156 domain-containing protein [Acidiferrobacterales bacterium]|jgi:hypothetical protein